jgi:hypothetical protein
MLGYAFFSAQDTGGCLFLTDLFLRAGVVFAPEDDRPSAIDDGRCGLVYVESLNQPPKDGFVGKWDMSKNCWVSDSLSVVFCVGVTRADAGRRNVSFTPSSTVKSPFLKSLNSEISFAYTRLREASTVVEPGRGTY